MSLEAKIIHPPKLAIGRDGDHNFLFRVIAFNHPADGIAWKVLRSQTANVARACRLAILAVPSSFKVGDGIEWHIRPCMMPSGLPNGSEVAGVEWLITSDRHPWKELPFRFVNDAMTKLVDILEHPEKHEPKENKINGSH